MTAGEFILILVRRWYIVLLGVALTGVCGYALVGREPMYYTRVEVVVLPPQERPDVNVLTRGPYSLTEIASLLVAEYNKEDRPLPMNNTDATLYGQGVRSGEQIRLHNSGSQWVSIFDKPVIEVEVVDPDPLRVQAEVEDATAALQQLLDQHHDFFGIKRTSQVSLRESPADPVIQEIRGNRSRTAAATILLGGWITLVAAYLTDRVLRRRHRSRSADQDVIRTEATAPELAVPTGRG